MTDAIRPALTPEEWDDAAGEPLYALMYQASSSEHDEGIPYRVQCMALANHALPDGHPNKLTRADVKALREIAGGGYYEDCGCGLSYATANEALLLSLAARIEALLPPEGV